MMKRRTNNTNFAWALAVALATCCLFSLSHSSAQETSTEPTQAVVLIVGAEGSDEYSEQFSSWANAWQNSAKQTQLTTIGIDANKDKSKQQLQQAIEKFTNETILQEVWLVMIGHGTFDGKRAKFNLHGPDVQAEELKSWLEPLKQRLVILNCTSSSSPFINSLSAKNRIVVTATRNGFEYNFARFGGYLSNSIDDPTIDLDKDGQTSVLEAFLAASRGADDFYQQENRIATEHALLDDNGDAKGTPATWFEGTRAAKSPKQGMPDGFLANQVFLNRRGVESSLSAQDRNIRDQLETQLEQLRQQKESMDESEFLLKIEPILIKLAELYEKTADDTKSP